jgi:catechol 2,3-dioxygenase-like lactoylglutathione lyase family enzyme
MEAAPQLSRQEYYKTNPKRKGLLGHISFGVTSIPQSEKFYTEILRPLGVSVVFSNESNTTVGFGITADEEVLTLFQRGSEAAPPGPGTHLAFNAPSREAVKEFWEAGIKYGGKSDGAPGLRNHYGEHYYAAFLVDPDGWRLEAVFQDGPNVKG